MRSQRHQRSQRPRSQKKRPRAPRAPRAPLPPRAPRAPLPDKIIQPVFMKHRRRPVEKQHAYIVDAKNMMVCNLTKRQSERYSTIIGRLHIALTAGTVPLSRTAAKQWLADVLAAGASHADDDVMADADENGESELGDGDDDAEDIY